MSGLTVWQSLIAFTLAAGLLTITPGFDTALVIRTAAIEGPRRAALAGLGCLTWGAAIAIGIGAVLAASELAFTAIKWAGAFYLGWLGLKLIVRPRGDVAAAAAAAALPDGAYRSFLAGFLGNLLNPKVGIFYISFLPQFVPAGVPAVAFTLALAAIHMLLGLLWFALLIHASHSLGRAISDPRVSRGLDRLTGVVFLGLGAKLALTTR